MSACNKCRYWKTSTWECLNLAISQAPTDALGYRMDNDACIKPINEINVKVVTPLYTGPLFGCVHFEKKMCSLINDNDIALYRLKVLRAALKLEICGLQRNGRSAYAIIKEETNLKGNKQSVYNQLSEVIATTTRSVNE